MRRVLAAALLLVMVASCQPLPHPLADNAPPPGAPIMMLKDGAGVAVEPVGGLPAPLSGRLAEALAAGLREADVPASTETRNRGSYILVARAEENALPRDRGRVTLRWELRQPDGKVAGGSEQTLETDLKAWRAGNDQLFAALASATAPHVAGLLQEDGVAAVDDGQRVIVPTVEGAPGDGPQTLANAMRNALRRANVEIAEGEKAGSGGHFTVAGTVRAVPAAAKQQDVTIIWTLVGRDGSQIGQVKQANRIPAGSLDGAWGDIAYAVANSAAPGIVALLDHLKTARSGS